VGPSIQTALFNAPLVVIVGWVMGKDMDLNFEIFMIVLLVLSIVVVGNFLRDGESNYLEGSLLVVSLSSFSFLVPCSHHVYTYQREFSHQVYVPRSLMISQIVYLIIAVAAWYYPNPDVATTNGIESVMARAAKL
jgi:Ca2+:H+ antiporter